jgi:hypothetical protein
MEPRLQFGLVDTSLELLLLLKLLLLLRLLLLPPLVPCDAIAAIKAGGCRPG